MRCALATDSNPGLRPIPGNRRAGATRRACALAIAAAVWLVVGCAATEPEMEEETVLATRTGETGIQVTESSRGGEQIVRVKTTFRGEDSVVVLRIDEPVYEIDIPLSIAQQRPPAAAGGAPGAGAAQGDLGSLLAAQYLERAQKAMLDGDYNEALRQVNLVLAVQPDNVQALMMKGSTYYAMGNYQLASEQWEQVLTIDPSNQEVREFQQFLESQQPAPAPNPPGAPAGAAPQPPPAEGGASAPRSEP